MERIMFTPEDIKAVNNGTASRSTVLAVLTSQTCGEPCWYASEIVCRCSCGGRNHGCLTLENGKRPDRTSRIDGARYKFRAVGKYGDLIPLAREINRLAGYRSIERPSLIVGGIGDGSPCTPEALAELKAQGKEAWVHQYSYVWRETDGGAPARLKSVSASQRKWIEMQGWAHERDIYILWECVDSVQPPSTLLLDKTTGLPLADQRPKAA